MLSHRAIAALIVVLLSAACAETPPATYPSVLPPPAAGDAAEMQDVEVDADGDSYADTDPSALIDFRETLEGHGEWAEDATYGTVWVPNRDEVGTDFAPYVTAGHWVYDEDYVWVSDYEWGWVPFHYGRWIWISGRGWGWIPGRVYAPAWVVWRLGDDEYPYLGWGAMPPLWIWRGGIAVTVAIAPRPLFVFCARDEVFAPVVAKRLIVGERGALVAGRTRPYVQAKPILAARPLAQPAMRGPSPSALRIEPSRVVRPTANERGVVRAQQYARPSSAAPLGARPAVPHVVRTPRRTVVRPLSPRPPPGSVRRK